MENAPIDRAVAKDQLKRINEELDSPHLLIGGLAVQQYYAARISKDIDLVCSFETAQHLVNTLYPSIDWKVDEKKNDEYRPSFQITHKVEDKGTIVFGPKISERAAYKHIDWDLLKKNAKPFRVASAALENILIPSAEALAYTKLISFLSRVGPEAKVKADLKDMIDLTNSDQFSASIIFDLIRRTGTFETIIAAFRKKCADYDDLIRQSCLYGLAGLFSNPEPEIKNITRTVTTTGTANIIPPLDHVKVNSPAELIEAIASNRVIEIASTSLDIGQVPDRYMKHIVWRPEYDGRTVVVRGVENLTILGTDSAPPMIFVKPAYPTVLAFDGCSNIKLANLRFGHKPEGRCTGGVLSFSECNHIEIEGCEMFGSGTQGLHLKLVEGFVLIEGKISECTNGIATFESSKNLRLERSTFCNNRKFFGLNIHDCEDIQFVDVEIYENTCEGDLFDVISSSPVQVVRGVIAENQCKDIGRIVGTEVSYVFKPS